MKAIVVSHAPSEPPVRWMDWPDPVARPGWVIVEIFAASLNRNDAMSVAERTTRDARAVIGSDGAGVIATVGSDVDGWHVGDEVVILPSLWWGDHDRGPDERFEILGDVTQGTFAQFVAIPQENVFRRPARLSWNENAALPLAGLTAWRALMTRGQLAAGGRVLITGASGGVASLAIMMAQSVGAEVFVTTSSSAKLDSALAIGATDGVVRHDGWEIALGEFDPFDVVLDSSGANWPVLIDRLSPGGTLVSIGRTAQNLAEVVVRDLFVGQRKIIGSSMGSPREFAAFLEHVDGARWKPALDSIIEMSRPDAAFTRLDASDRNGKVVLSC